MISSTAEYSKFLNIFLKIEQQTKRKHGSEGLNYFQNYKGVKVYMYEELSSAEARIKNLNNYLSGTKGKTMDQRTALQRGV